MSSNLNMNKVAAAVLLAGLIGMITGKATEFLYDGGPEHPGHHAEEARGYAIEVTEADAGEGGAAAPTGAPDIGALYATADVKAGETLFQKKCTVCHTVEKGGANKVGPHLWGVMGRKVAVVADFSYSSAMKSHGDRTWNFEEMNQFQFAPRKWVPGTIMAYAGTPKDQERANLIAYLNSQSDNPLALPAGPLRPADEPKAAGSEPEAGAAGTPTDAEPGRKGTQTVKTSNDEAPAGH